MARKKAVGEEGPRVPVWIVSFSDMVTLLLAFFVLLQTFASVRDPDLFFVGQGSFRRAIAGLGLPDWLFGRKDRPRRTHIKIKHSVDEGEPEYPRTKVLDDEDEKIRALFDDLKKDLETIAVDLSRQPIDVAAPPVRFARSQADLDEAARGHLRQFAFDLRQTLTGREVKLYVIGLAAEAPSPRQQWILSARRARAAASYLDALLKTGTQSQQWEICSWGGGAGGPWCRTFGINPRRSSLVVAIMKESG